MALALTDWLITSDITPESARFVPTADGGHWILSWLPDIPLSRERAISGMVLDETLSDPDPEDPLLAMELAAIRAADLGMELAEALLRLYARILERDRQQPLSGAPRLFTAA
ncbi:hypothetical protein [Nocardia arthritidis]|uniref:Uncharacterized protein n=1 Tax=Nocardia arthritidis TaxID=228602 RepID=A0A6G9YR59_9NOCA|nr:hypothetical protein [Nocardia arthritidis]QIS15661.1 hypothetical protein F5544_39200 [Nocardia arthritidis]